MSSYVKLTDDGLTDGAAVSQHRWRVSRALTAAALLAGLGSTVSSDAPPSVCSKTRLDDQRSAGIAAPVLGGPDDRNLAGVTAARVTFCGTAAEVRGLVTDARYDAAAIFWGARAWYSDGHRKILGSGMTVLSSIQPFARPENGQMLTGLDGGYTYGIASDPRHGSLQGVEIFTQSGGSGHITTLMIPNPQVEVPMPPSSWIGEQRSESVPTDRDLATATREALDRWLYLNSDEPSAPSNPNPPQTTRRTAHRGRQERSRRGKPGQPRRSGAS